MTDDKPFDKELFYRLCEEYNVELSDKYDKPMIKESDGNRVAYENSTAVQMKRLDKKMKDEEIQKKLDQLKAAKNK